MFLGTQRQNELLSIEFSQLTLEPALQLMSPTVYVDYEIETRLEHSTKTAWDLLFRCQPGRTTVTAVVNGSTQSMLIEGNTEDGVEPETEARRRKVEETSSRSFLKQSFND